MADQRRSSISASARLKPRTTMAYKACGTTATTCAMPTVLEHRAGTDLAEAVRDLDQLRNAVHYLVQDRSPRSKHSPMPIRPAIGASKRLGGTEKACGQTLRGRLDQRRRGQEIRHRHARTCSGSGTGSSAPSYVEPSACRFNDRHQPQDPSAARCWPALICG